MQRPTTLPLLAIFLLAPAASHAQAQQSAPAAAALSTALPPALEVTIAQSREALHKILNGDPSGYCRLVRRSRGHHARHSKSSMVSSD